jgi:hypothetical protein
LRKNGLPALPAAESESIGGAGVVFGPCLRKGTGTDPTIEEHEDIEGSGRSQSPF